MGKTIEEKIAVMKAFADGAAIEMYGEFADKWADNTNPLWDWRDFDYRVKPLDLTALWSVIDSRWQWVAKDEDGRVFVFLNKPTLDSAGKWQVANRLFCVPVSEIFKDVPYEHSLFQRPSK